jgi:hypothetical protein
MHGPMKSMETEDTVTAAPQVVGIRELTAQVRQDVRRYTSGRIHNLTVIMTGTHVVLEGFCSSFHSYQLAQHAAMRAAEDFSVDNRIEVL